MFQVLRSFNELQVLDSGLGFRVQQNHYLNLVTFHYQIYV